MTNGLGTHPRRGGGDAAWAAVREIADAITGPPVDLAVFWAYAAGAFDDPITAERYDAAVATLRDRFSGGFASPGLYGGLAGAGWVVAHISDDNEELLAIVDDQLLESLDAAAVYDLVHGVVGIGVYFAERLRTEPAAQIGLDRVVDRLAAMSETSPAGTTWFTRPEQLPAWQRAICPDGYYNLGLAHGVPGVIGLLGSIDTAKARELGERATSWLRAEQLAPDPRGRFASWIPPARPPLARARTAWCYGDLGIAAAAWSAAIRTDRDPTVWRALALACATRSEELTQIADANLCHGAAGIAHLCNRFFQASRDPVFRDAARTWFARMLAMRRPGEGIAGFTARHFIAEENRYQHQTSGDFLDGTIGVALALLAALRDEEPGWDRLLLCDLPPA